MKRRKGTLLISIGLLLMAAALFLTGYNLWDDYRAGKMTQMALAQIVAGTEGNDGLDAGTGAGAPQREQLPDYMRYPDMEMPVKEIDVTQHSHC